MTYIGCTLKSLPPDLTDQAVTNVIDINPTNAVSPHARQA